MDEWRGLKPLDNYNEDLLPTKEAEDEWDREREDEQIRKGHYRKGWSD